MVKLVHKHVKSDSTRIVWKLDTIKPALQGSPPPLYHWYFATRRYQRWYLWFDCSCFTACPRVDTDFTFICFWWRHELRQLWYMMYHLWFVCVFSLGYSSAPECLERVLWPRTWLCESTWEQQQQTTSRHKYRQCWYLLSTGFSSSKAKAAAPWITAIGDTDTTSRAVHL